MSRRLPEVATRVRAIPAGLRPRRNSVQVPGHHVVPRPRTPGAYCTSGDALGHYRNRNNNPDTHSPALDTLSEPVAHSMLPILAEWRCAWQLYGLRRVAIVPADA